jgi:hypothetical protein
VVFCAKKQAQKTRAVKTTEFCLLAPQAQGDQALKKEIMGKYI